MLAAAQTRGRGDVPGTGVPTLIKRAAAPFHVPVEVQEVGAVRVPLVHAMGRSRRAAPSIAVETTRFRLLWQDARRALWRTF